MKNKKILIVEDEIIVAESIKHVLVKAGYNVSGILTFAEDAIEFVKSSTPDLVLMDILLEGQMSGLDAAGKIYTEYGIPVVFLTSYSDHQTLKKAVEVQPYGYILKPFSDRELLVNLELAFYKDKMTSTLKNQEKFLRQILNHNPNPIYVKDKEGNFVLVNDSQAEMYNMKADDIVGYNEKYLLQDMGISKNQYKRIVQEDKQILTSNFPLFKPMEEFNTDSKDPKFFQTTKLPILLPDTSMGILGVAVDISRRKLAEEELKKRLNQLRDLMHATVNGLVTAMEMRDPYTAGHQRRVAILSKAIAIKMGLDESKVDGILLSALIHDIGKMSIPAEILSKPGELTDSEMKLIRYHPESGYEILKSIDFPWPVADIVLQHHERLDGSGYPKGLKGNEILLEAKIIAVSDLIEAMASYRPYRPAIGISKAIKEIDNNKGILYDLNVVKACKEVLKENPLDF